MILDTNRQYRLAFPRSDLAVFPLHPQGTFGQHLAPSRVKSKGPLTVG